MTTTATELDRRPLAADAAAPDLRTELPGPVAAAIIARDEAVTSPSLTRVYPLVVRRAAGCVLEDVDGNRFLDFNAGIAVVAAGHAHPEVNAAIHAQVDDVLHYCSSDFYLPGLRRPLRAAGRAWRRCRRPSTGCAPSCATPAPRRSRRRSSSPATTPGGPTSSPSSARSTGGRSAACR